MVLTVGISGGNWIEIAYGTESGVVRIIVQHPETVYAAGHGPQLFQTFTVHRSPVVKVMLSEKHLISGIACKTCFTLLQYLLRFSLLFELFKYLKRVDISVYKTLLSICALITYCYTDST